MGKKGLTNLQHKGSNQGESAGLLLGSTNLFPSDPSHNLSKKDALEAIKKALPSDKDKLNSCSLKEGE